MNIEKCMIFLVWWCKLCGCDGASVVLVDDVLWIRIRRQAMTQGRLCHLWVATECRGGSSVGAGAGAPLPPWSPPKPHDPRRLRANRLRRQIFFSHGWRREKKKKKRGRRRNKPPSSPPPPKFNSWIHRWPSASGMLRVSCPGCRVQLFFFADFPPINRAAAWFLSLIFLI